MTVPTPYVYNAWVVSVHDGDTINCVIDRGMYEYAGNEKRPVPVRILGGAARELSEPGGIEARDYLRGLLPPGTPVVLSTAKPDKYGPRWLAAVTFVSSAGDTDLAAWLVTTGWMARWDGKGPQPKPAWPIP